MMLIIWDIQVLYCHFNEWKNNTYFYIDRRQYIDDVFINCGIWNDIDTSNGDR